jgi:predicted KAP-like P-loop ATPase
MSSMVPSPIEETTGHSLQPLSTTRANTVASKQKTAWGVGGSATIARAKTFPEPVATLAASQVTRVSSTTINMTKEQKKAPTSTSSSNGKKKKHKDELKALAFGR